MMDNKYILDGKTPVLEPNLLKWANWYESADRHVKNTHLGDVQISTVFLSLAHNFGEEGPPILFETMVFGGTLDEKQCHYSTWDEAEAGHNAMVDRIRKVT